MQVKPILYTVLIALGFALLANSWVIQKDESSSVDLQKSSLSGFNAPLAVPAIISGKDTLEVALFQPPPVRYDTLDVAVGIQDLVLEARIKKQLFKNKSLRSERISVTAVKGRVVLEGRVPSQEVKQLIEATVERVNGVIELQSKIKHS